MFDPFNKLEKKWMIDDTVSRSSHDNDIIRASCVESNFLKPARKNLFVPCAKKTFIMTFFKVCIPPDS